MQKAQLDADMHRWRDLGIATDSVAEEVVGDRDIINRK